jgi:hypothetical protein
MNRQQLLKQLEKGWTAVKKCYAGLSESQMMEPGVVGDWSVKDILGHISTWEEEALKYLPLILNGRRPPRYSVQYGGINAFNARMVAKKRSWPLLEVLKQLDDTHAQLLNYIHSVPEDQFTRETRFRRRLRLDTYAHYPKHVRGIKEWTSAQMAPVSGQTIGR